MSIEAILKEGHARLFPPSLELDPVLHSLSDAHGIELPPDYREFLSVSDGALIGEAELFSCVPHLAPPHSYQITTLEEANERRRGQRAAIVIGSHAEDLLAYDGELQRYTVADRIDLDPFESFESFADLLSHVKE